MSGHADLPPALIAAIEGFEKAFKQMRQERDDALAEVQRLRGLINAS